MAPSTYLLESGWEFKETNGNHVPNWLPVSKVPTNVHLDLLDNDVIRDPFIDMNELECEWVAETSWSYKTILPSIRSEAGERAALCFSGLDTFATVYLNDDVLLISDNMFHSHRIDITHFVHSHRPLELRIVFESAFKRARELKAKQPRHEWVAWNGDTSRLAVRKAQFHWGWDWGPLLSPCGPWRPVQLEVFHSRVSNVKVDYKLSSALDRVEGTIRTMIEGSPSGPVTFTISKDLRVILQQTAFASGNGTCELDFSFSDPDLWFPYQYGSQDLYDFKVSCGPEDFSITTKVGLRKVDLVQEKDQVGRSFHFKINNIPIFAGGSNWIPIDSFTPRGSRDKYEKWLQTLVAGNQSMIRVWGGGIYEEDCFYDICDELGILVWQDFLFSCGNYPTSPTFLHSIAKEAQDNVRRLRHHPSLVIFAGNNEDYQVQESFGLKYDHSDTDTKSWSKTNFPARYIYEQLLPDIMKREAPDIPYHPGSPWSHGKKTSDPTVGDMHQWNVWHGTQEKYQIFDTLGGRFNSEFGMEAFPHIDTIKAFCTDPTELYPQSRVLDFHNKADRHERRIATYLVENFRTVTSLEGHIHLSQLVQSEALMFAYRGWRRQWGQERLCGGALVWQLNDCWPVTSWSIVDYYHRKKPAFYTIRRALAPVSIAVNRQHWDWSVVHARPPKKLTFECWISSSELETQEGRVELRFVSIATGEEIKPAIHKNVSIIPNGTTEVCSGTVDEQTEEPHVLTARLWIDDKVVSRDSDWPQPFKYISFENRNVKVTSIGIDRLKISAALPTKGLVFEEREGVLVQDSALDVMPGDDQIVEVSGLKEGDKPLRWRYLGMEDA